jgi:hypothetical protein
MDLPDVKSDESRNTSVRNASGGGTSIMLRGGDEPGPFIRGAPDGKENTGSIHH